MFKAFTGALSLALAILVLNWLLPEVMHLFIEAITKILLIANYGLDSTISQLPQ